MQGMLAGVASVAMATKLAPKFPEIPERFTDYIIVDDVTAEPLYGVIGESYAKALAESLVKTTEQQAFRVMSNAFT